MPRSTIFAIVMLLAISPACLANSSAEAERINGVVDFLLDRAQQNHFYIYEQRLKESDALNCYFPTIHSHVQDGDLRLLLLGRDVWAQSIKEDMKALVARSVAGEINRTIAFKPLAMASIDSYLSIVPYLLIEYQAPS